MHGWRLLMYSMECPIPEPVWPFGAMASVVSTDPIDRSKLSVAAEKYRRYGSRDRRAFRCSDFMF